MVALLVAGAVLTAAATPALAAGDSTLDSYIISDPEAGWTAAPQAEVQIAAGLFSGLYSAATRTKVTAAAEEWQAPAQTESLLIVLVHFPSRVPGAVSSSSDATGSACGSGGTTTTFPDPTITGSEEAICSASTGSSQVTTAITFERTNVQVIVLGYGPMPTVEVQTAAADENAQVPAGGISEGGLPVALIAGIAAGVVVIGLVLLVIVLQRRSRSATGPSGTVAATWGDTDAAWSGLGPSAWPQSGASSFGAPGASQGSTGPPPYMAPPSAGGPSPYAAPPAARAPSAYAASPTAAPPPYVAPPPSTVPAQPGWYPVDGNVYEQRYSDGQAWIARKRWDGTDWVDVVG